MLKAPLTTGHDYCDISNDVMVCKYEEAAITYIAGFVSKTVNNHIGCPECITALTEQDPDKPSLVALKSNGGLVVPSESVIEINTETERNLFNMTGGKL